MNAQQQKANPHPKEYIIDKTILDEIEKGVDGEWGEGVFAKYWGGNAIRSRPHPAPTQCPKWMPDCKYKDAEAPDGAVPCDRNISNPYGHSSREA
jgi:hypothetical protein